MNKRNLILKGDRLVVKDDLNKQGLSSWATAYTGSFECTIPKKTIMIADWDQVKGAKGFGCIPENYIELEPRLVPESVRTAHKYSGYYFVFLNEDISSEISLISYTKLKTEELNEMLNADQFCIKLRAAIELYQRDEKEIALKFLKDQLLSRQPLESKDSAMALAMLKDSTSIELLLSNLGELNNISIPYALSQFEDEKLRENLLSLSELKSLRGIHAFIALALLGQSEAGDKIIHITKNWKKFSDKFLKDAAYNYFIDLWKMLGINSKNKKTNDFFVRCLDEQSLGAIIRGFVMQDEYPKTLHINEVWEEVGSKIVTRFGWDKYLNTTEKKHAFTFPPLDKSADEIRKNVTKEILLKI